MPIVAPVDELNNFCCINLMKSEAEALKIDPSLEMRSAGTKDALYSNQNGGALFVIEDGKEKPSASSSRKAKIKYSTKECTIGSDTPLTKCNITADAVSDPFKFADVEITGVYNWKFKLNDTDIRTMCENRVEFYNKVLRNRLDAAIQGYNAALIAQTVPYMGKYPISGVESLTTPISVPIVTAVGVPNPAGLALIKTIYEQMNQNANPIIVGAGKLDFVQNAMAYAGLSTTGIDAAKFRLDNVFRDTGINSSGLVPCTDGIISWLPGAIRPVEFFQNSGDFIERGPVINVGGINYFQYEFGRIELGGIVWDFFMKRDCDQWVFAFQKEFEVVPLPPDAFGDCQDYNYALAFCLDCGDLNCDDINGAVTSGGVGLS